MNLIELDKNIHIIHVINKLLYERTSYEFLSEFIYRSKDYFLNDNNHKTSILWILEFCLSIDKIFIQTKQKNGTVIFYNSSNFKDLVSIVKDKWTKFNNHNEVELWYSYEIGYTDLWKEELNKLEI